MSTPPKAAPPRLTEGDGPVSRLLGAAVEAPAEATTARRERVWRDLTQRPRRAPARWALPVGALAAVAALVVFLRPPAPSTVTLVSGEVEAKRGADAWASVEVGQTLAAGASLRTGEHGRAFLRSSGGGALLLEGSRAELGKGVELRLEQGLVIASARVVTAGGYRLEGTSFAVRVGADQTVEVFAHEGSVQVRGPGVELQVASAHAWSSKAGLNDATLGEPEHALIRSLVAAHGEEAELDIPGPAGAAITVDGLPVGTAPLKLLASVGPHSVQGTAVEVKPGAATRLELPRERAAPAANADSLAWEQATQLERDGHPEQALAIHDALARGNGSRAEASLYVAGRIRLRVLGDAKGALAAFAEHQRRFPDGALVQEVALSAIEAQLKLEQFEAALAAMDAFVARNPGSERLAEVHFLQAQVHSQRGECALALPLFAGLLEDPRRADDALYLTAYCEQALNRHVAARKHLQQYLARFPAGKHVAEARSALGKR